MSRTILIDFQTQTGPYTVIYDLVDNPIADQWYKKIQLLQEQNIGVDPDLTSTFYGKSQPYEYYKNLLDSIVDWVNTNADGYQLVKKDYYTQEDLCCMHDVYVELANNPLYDSIIETYQLNKYIHLCENTINGPMSPRTFTISWGTNDGLTMEEFTKESYQYYTQDQIPGNLYLFWSEIGKKPREYWHDKDPDNLENFLKVVRPHRTWSAHCKINLANPYYASRPFWDWFSKYKTQFLSHWGLTEWSDLHETGGIELARLRNPTDHARLLNEFISLDAVRIN